MDRSLDEIISDRPRPSIRGRRDNRRNDWLPDGVKKSSRREPARELDDDWVHDRYEHDPDSRRSTRPKESRRTIDRYEPSKDGPNDGPGKLRVDNLHYELNEDDLQELFQRIGPVSSCQILYDRQDRSRGTAYVTYASLRDADRAIREFDGANAYGQPIKLTLSPTGPATASRRNPFDSVIKPSRSLFDRIDSDGAPRERRRRSESPRRSDLSKPPPNGIDRYVPGDRSGPRRSRSPMTRRGGSRRPGGGREYSDRPRGGRDRDGRLISQGRARKTAQELDAEMADYWGKEPSAVGTAEGGDGAAAQNEAANGAAAPGASTSSANLDGDIDMIE